MNVFQRITLRTLGMNKIRTLVTVIGIVLSAAMFTAVTTSISSLQSFLVEVVIEQDGDWHGAVLNAPQAQVDRLNQNEAVESYVTLQNIGYASLEALEDQFKPYLFVGGMSPGFAKKMPVDIIEGRLPETALEIILPKHLQIQGGVKHNLGDVLALDIGSRMASGQELTQNNGLVSGEDGETEELVTRQRREFTVVGFYEYPSFEDYAAPGYTALTIASAGDPDQYDAYIKLNRARDIFKFLETQFAGYGSKTNMDLLRFSGASDETTFNATLYGLAAILIALIMFGSISLIYNAFSISVSERTKQFGLLSSVGATRRQMMQSVLFEAAFLSLLGVPLGILAGLAGIGVTFRLASGLLRSFLASFSNTVVLDLSVSWAALITAITVALVTVLISAYLPAQRAFKVSAIDAIRQSGDINISAKAVRTSGFAARMFGFEGMIAEKNFKRNQKKYRATVISLFLSVVLFISASSFCAYLEKSATSLIDNLEFDVTYTLSSDEAGHISAEDLYRELSSAGGVAQSGYASVHYEMVRIPADQIDSDYLAYLQSRNAVGASESGLVDVSATFYFIQDALYEAYLEENNVRLDSAGFPKAAVLDFVRIFDGSESRYYTYNLLGQNASEVVFGRQKSMPGYAPQGFEYDEQGNRFAVYLGADGEALRLEQSEALEEIPLEIGAVVDQKPFVVAGDQYGISLIYPYSALPEVFNRANADVDTTMYFKSGDHQALVDTINDILVEKGLSSFSLHNYAERAESNRALVAVVNIFSYGFIVLISLIAAANVFNTVSTNIGLRRREFAMLKSIGMTQKGFNKMMNFECLLYGLKSVLYGIPVSVGVTYLIYRAVMAGYETSFFIPWYSAAIAVGSVFAVVFATMLYAMNKIKADNLVDALRNENL